MFSTYRTLTQLSGPLLRAGLGLRRLRGKEDPGRIAERTGIPGQPRPAGRLAWFHAASVGEAQSALSLIDALLRLSPEIHILVTTGTVTSAALMERRLPARTIHQYYPLDHPHWVGRFLDHWQPDMIVWMESELWPNMLHEIRHRHIHCTLVNGRMSPRSYRRWSRAQKSLRDLLVTFDMILAQTAEDAARFEKLGAIDVRVRENIKYAALPLPCDEDDLAVFKKAIGLRPRWMYASTHDGEENLACELHTALARKFPDLLTIIVPRHPDRRDAIAKSCAHHGHAMAFRGDNKNLPLPSDAIYVADTLGELGLFYRASPIAVIGRSFSLDGGGGHNPIEAAQLGCAVLHGPMVQNLEAIFEEMNRSGAARRADTPEELLNHLDALLSSARELDVAQENGLSYARSKNAVLDTILEDLKPALIDCGITPDIRAWA
jgi:3-deoxy-D-manno-octulosonic-acid transferase